MSLPRKRGKSIPGRENTMYRGNEARKDLGGSEKLKVGGGDKKDKVMRDHEALSCANQGSGLQPGSILAHRGHLSMPGNIFSCHNRMKLRVRGGLE